ncbi:hypothetical protein HYT45_04395 [Candidatus Uhrbacteria bacterium]|nr:hypothetical protein [Candidatus Uhrbacteria bacterium]
MKIKNIIFFVFLIVFALAAQYGFLEGAFYAPVLLLLGLNVIVWLFFFFGRKEAFVAALCAGLITELYSPYYFGSAILSFTLSALAAEFFSAKVFTNRSFYSFVAAAFSSFAVYFLSLFAAAVISYLGRYKVFIAPLEFRLGEIAKLFGVNLLFLFVIYILTNLFTKKMHSAFIVSR